MLEVTGSHLAGIDLGGSLCPATIDALIDLLKLVKAQALAKQAEAPGGSDEQAQSADTTPAG